ncbi:hypothetical protein [Halosolutus halophilus]|nr:hypothetical protein [Halosolutus halophilus]
MANTPPTWSGGLVLDRVVLAWTSVLAAVAIAGTAVGPPKAGQRR